MRKLNKYSVLMLTIISIFQLKIMCGQTQNPGLILAPKYRFGITPFLDLPTGIDNIDDALFFYHREIGRAHV